MPNDLDDNKNKIHQHTSEALEALEILKKKQQNEADQKKIRGRVLLTIFIFSIILIITIILVNKSISWTNARNQETERISSSDTTIATIKYLGEDRCSITNNLHIFTISWGSMLDGYNSLAPRESTTENCTFVEGSGRCFNIDAENFYGEFASTSYQICAQ
jgi:hypothetical protein